MRYRMVNAALGARALTAALVAGAVGLAAVGCSSSDETASHDHGTTVVASTDVWGSVAEAVTAGHATVTSIVKGSAVDPHSFEASPSDAAAIADASLVVYNGGGYDHWVDDVLAGHSGVSTVDAYSLLNATDLGLHVTPEQPANEHVFYDPFTAKAVALQIAEKLAAADADHAAEYRANAAEFGKQTDAIAASEAAIAKAHPDTSVVSTEPVAFYLLVLAGITDRTPSGFAQAAEEGDDPSPADIAAMLDLIDKHQVSALLFNPQTETAATKQVEDAARRSGVPVVTVTETLPADKDYLTWQRDTVEALARQLDNAPRPNP